MTTTDLRSVRTIDGGRKFCQDEAWGTGGIEGPKLMNSSIKRFFPDSEVSLIHQNGERLSEPSKGVEVILHTRENESHPCLAELISGEHHAEIGLSFEGDKLCDYDGIFFLPRELGQMLNDAGYRVPEDCYE